MIVLAIKLVGQESLVMRVLEFAVEAVPNFAVQISLPSWTAQ